MKRPNLAGWLVVLLLIGLGEICVRVLDLHDSVAAPSATFRALADGLASGTLSGEIASTLESYAEGLALAIVARRRRSESLIGSSRMLLDAVGCRDRVPAPDPGRRAHPARDPLLRPRHRRSPFRRRLCSRLADSHQHDLRRSRRSTACSTTSRGRRASDRLGELFHVTLPAALPSIATGIRVSAAIALVVCVTAEFLTGAGGIGAYMEGQQFANKLPELYAAVVLVGLLGLAVNAGAAGPYNGVRCSGPARSGGGERDGRRAARRVVVSASSSLSPRSVSGSSGRERGLVPRADGERGGKAGLGRLADIGFPVGVGASMKRFAARLRDRCGDRYRPRASLGRPTRARRTLDPFLECLRAVPAIAIVPAAILVLGLGDASRSPSSLSASAFRSSSTRPKVYEPFRPRYGTPPRCCTSGGWSALSRIYLPAALPSIMAGLRIAVSLGLVLVIVSEFVGEQNGIGYYLLIQQSEFDFPRSTRGSCSSACSDTCSTGSSSSSSAAFSPGTTGDREPV